MDNQTTPIKLPNKVEEVISPSDKRRLATELLSSSPPRMSQMEANSKAQVKAGSPVSKGSEESLKRIQSPSAFSL